MHFTLEICCYDLASALVAQQNGAHRVELCADAGTGGTTPAFGLIRTARELLKIKLYPIIRPRGGDFFYNDEEFNIMLNDIALCREIGCDGVVIGMLKQDGSVDVERCAELVEMAKPLGVTFHRAFDRVSDPFKALEDVIGLGCERILTSGLKPAAMQGTSLIHDLVKQAGNRISIMPGSGVRAANITELATATGAHEFHSSAAMRLPTKMNYINAAMKEDNTSVIADGLEIQIMLKHLHNYFLSR